jgi:hypothetical protein
MRNPSWKFLVRTLLLIAGPIVATGSLLTAEAADPAKTSDNAKVLADTGFRPSPNGFSFENWSGDQYPYSDLTANDAMGLFGERVCARIEGEQCIPTPAAKLWLQGANKMKKGGHCEGMAAMSGAFYIKQEKPADYGANQAFGLKPEKKELMRTISAYFITQALEPVQMDTRATQQWPLQKIVDFMVTNLKAGKDSVTLGIYGADGGHAITPYKVEEHGPGKYRVFVYDNNYPGAEKYVDIDAGADRWQYSGAALNPKEDPKPWEGTSGAMDVTLLSWRYEPLQCPFCGDHKPPSKRPKAPRSPSGPATPRKPSVNSDGYAVLTPNRCSQVRVTSKRDKKQLSGSKNEINGGYMRPLRGARGCSVRLPRDQQYDVALVDDGRPYYSPTTSFIVFSDGNVYSMSDIALSSATTQSFSFTENGFGYTAGGSQKPTLQVAGDHAGSNGYYEVSGFTLTDGYSFTATENDTGEVVFGSDDPTVDDFDISAEIVGESGDESYAFADVEVGDDGQAILHIEEDGDLELDIDSDSDGTSDETDADDDNDGTPDGTDTDDDGDGVSDDKEPADFDEDGVPDARDTDDDNDGIADATDVDDATADAGDDDSDHDGVADEADTDDDNDGTLDATDKDDDNDGVPDDKDTDTVEASAGGDDADHDSTADDADTDDDNDGTPDATDTDEDGDGAADAQDPDDADDADHDGTADDADTDDDNDGTPDATDTDDDGDGTADAADTDDDGADDDSPDDGGGDEGGGDDGGGDDGGGDE